MGATDLDNLLVTQLCIGWKSIGHFRSVQIKRGWIFQELIWFSGRRYFTLGANTSALIGGMYEQPLSLRCDL